VNRKQILAYSIFATIVILAFIACPNPCETTQEPYASTGVITGQALFTSGTDHGGITITLEETDGLRSASFLNANHGIAMGARSVGARTFTATTQTATDGSFTFNNIPEGRYILYASSRDSLEQAVAIGVTVAAGEVLDLETLRLTPVGSMSGQITVDNTGAWGFLVSVAGTSFMAVTDVNGIFTISGIPAGNNYHVIVMRGNFTDLLTPEPHNVFGGQTTYLPPRNITSAELNTVSDIRIGENGNWWVNGVDTNIPAQGPQGPQGEPGQSPVITIGENGNWWINGKDTGIQAQGPQGEQGPQGDTPHIGPNGNWWIGSTDTGIRAQVEPERLRYVFLFIGDGMGAAQVTVANIFATKRNSHGIELSPLSFPQFPVSGTISTLNSKGAVTDSAAAATALASGRKTINGVINMDATLTKEFKTIAEYAKEAGMRVGIITSITLNHATPAGFYARTPSRDNYYDIAVQLANSNFNFFGGGAISQRRGANGNQRDAVEIATANGFTFVNTLEGFNALRPGIGRVIAVNPGSSGAMPYEIDRRENELSLADFTRKGIELLENPGGFFMMIEGGNIDTAGHANDPGAVIHDVIAFDNAVRVALEFAQRHPRETLIVVTADHETGGMSIDEGRFDDFFNTISLQTRSGTTFTREVLDPYRRNTPAAQRQLADLLPAIREFFGLDFDNLTAIQRQQMESAFQQSMGSGGSNQLTTTLTRILSQNAGIGWTTTGHTTTPVLVFAYGAGQEHFVGFYANNDLFFRLARTMDLDVD